MPSNEEVPTELAPKLIHRFMSNEGYELQPGASEVLKHLRESPQKNFDRVVVGVITNSDPRVPEVLSSLGLRVSSLRYGAQAAIQAEPNAIPSWDIDFSVMSYDVGGEKPDSRIFDAALEMLEPALRSRGDATASVDLKGWEKVCVGDEYDKDVVGSQKAGWYSILISEEAVNDGQDGKPVQWLDDEPVSESSSLLQIFESGKTAVGFRSLSRIVDWLRL